MATVSVRRREGDVGVVPAATSRIGIEPNRIDHLEPGEGFLLKNNQNETPE